MGTIMVEISGALIIPSGHHLSIFAYVDGIPRELFSAVALADEIFERLALMGEGAHLLRDGPHEPLPEPRKQLLGERPEPPNDGEVKE